MKKNILVKKNIMEENLLPIYALGIGEIRDGIFIKAPLYCKKKKNATCEKHYKGLFENNQEGLYICPYGFNSYCYKNDNVVEIFTSLTIEGKFNIKKVKPKIEREDHYNVIKYEDFEKYLEFSISKEKTILDNKHLKDFIDNTFHDLRAFNAHIKNKSQLIIGRTESQSKKRYKKIESDSRNIWAMSEFISNRLNSYDFLYYPSYIKSSLNTFKIFDKVRRCFLDDCKEKKVQIKLDPNGECNYIELFESFELIPFLMVDNAVKYSLNNKDIVIYIDDSVDRQEIIIESISPRMNYQEIHEICNRGFRGSNAKKLGVEGSGIGMYLVKGICDSLNIKLGISSSEDIITTYNDIEYSIFKVELEIIK